MKDFDRRISPLRSTQRLSKSIRQAEVSNQASPRKLSRTCNNAKSRFKRDGPVEAPSKFGVTLNLSYACRTVTSDYDSREDILVGVGGDAFTCAAGIAGLAKGGAKVAVLEEHTAGWGASSRNGGMVLTGLKLDADTLISRYGREATKRMYAASLPSIDCVERIVREENIACDFAHCGHLEVACKPTHFDDFCFSAEVIAREFSHNLRIVPKSELRSEIGS